MVFSRLVFDLKNTPKIKLIIMIQVKQQPNHKNFSFILDELFTSLPQTLVRESKATSQIPPANINETNDGYHLELLVPGRNKEDFKVSIEKDLLTVSFENKSEAENKDFKTIRKEFGFPNFSRSFHLDEKVNADGILAKYENGVLKFFLPKKEEVKVSPKQIAIQ